MDEEDGGDGEDEGDEVEGDGAAVEAFAAKAGPEDGEDEAEEEGGDELGGGIDGVGDGEGDGKEGEIVEGFGDEPHGVSGHVGGDDFAAEFAEDVSHANAPRFHDDDEDDIGKKLADNDVEEAGGEFEFTATEDKEGAGGSPEDHGGEDESGGAELDASAGAGFATREDDEEGGGKEQADGDELGDGDLIAKNEAADEEGEDGGELGEDGDAGGFFVGEGAIIENARNGVEDADADEEKDVGEGEILGWEENEEEDEGEAVEEDAEDFLGFGAATAEVGVGDKVVYESGDGVEDGGDDEEDD